MHPIYGIYVFVLLSRQHPCLQCHEVNDKVLNFIEQENLELLL